MAKELREITKEELEVVLEAHELWLKSDGEKGERANLSNINLIGVSLEGVNLSEADLEGINFTSANLTNAIFKKADLKRANLIATDLSYTNFEGAKLPYANLSGAILTQANLENTNLINASLRGSVLILANLEGADLTLANLNGASLELASYDVDHIKNAAFVNPKYLTKKDIILDTKSQIQSLEEEKKELQEKLAQSSSTSQEEKEKLKQLEAQLEKAEQTIQREQEAKKKTKEQIKNAVKHLKNPNTYISKQITIQYILMGLYVVLSIGTVWFFIQYIDANYTAFKLNMNPETTFINWLFYASPLLISFSLIIVFINQINARLQNIVRLNERKRYVDSVEGGLQAINALSINNEDARKKILDTMEKIIDHTLQSSEKANEPITLDENAVEDPLTTLSKIKGLLK